MLTVTLTVPPSLAAYPEAVRRVLPEIAEAVHNDIRTMALQELTSAGMDYTSSLGILHVPLSPATLRSGTTTFATIVLTGWLANAVEHGHEPFDMKPGLLQGRNAKEKAGGGRYNVVAFRHMTPGTSGRYGQAMGSAEVSHEGLSRSDAELLGKRVYKAARQLSATRSQPGSGTAWGDRLGAGAGGAKPLTNPRSGYAHKHDVYEGMVRKEKDYAAATQSSYVTFRAVSTDSDPSSWQHPGIIRHDFFGRAVRDMPGTVEMAFRSVVVGLGGAGA